MAFTEITLAKYASDLVVAHADFHFSNDEANITPAGVIPFGTVVFRPKDSAPTVAWEAVAEAADVAATNEFGIVFGDHYGFKYDFTPKAISTGKWNAILTVRDAGFKEYYIKAVHATALGAAPYALLKQLMANQGLIVLKDVSDYVVA